MAVHTDICILRSIFASYMLFGTRISRTSLHRLNHRRRLSPRGSWQRCPDHDPPVPHARRHDRGVRARARCPVVLGSACVGPSTDRVEGRSCLRTEVQVIGICEHRTDTDASQVVCVNARQLARDVEYRVSCVGAQPCVLILPLFAP